MPLNEIDLNLPEADALSYSQIQENEHFEVDELNGLFHWESTGPCEALGLCSEDGLETAELAADEARDCISLATAYGVEEALALMDELTEMMASFYPSDREAIYSGCAVIPIDQRWLAIYNMAKRTKPMPPAKPFSAALIGIAIAGASLLSFIPSASANYYQNGRWFTVENTAYYLRVDEWRKIRGYCYRLHSDHSVEERTVYQGSCTAPSGKG